MIYHGSSDPVFPMNLTVSTWNAVLNVLGVRDTIKIEHIEPGMTHTVIQKEFEQVIQFIKGGP